MIKRYKRFLCDVELENGGIVTAHVANSGSMMGLKEPGLTVWLSPANNPKRKLQYSWELVEIDNGLVGINTSLPNGIVAESISASKIPSLTGYDTLRREVKYGENSRIDILLSDSDKPDCYVEVKNVTLKREEDFAEFPDAVTSRGTKHLKELGNMVKDGHRAVMFYLIQRQDCKGFALAHDIDPAYAEAFTVARKMGVEILCYDCHITTHKIELGTAQPLID
ncbi:DNA/RNA nuclease SfsA [Sneathiella marina]|uniref:Sugar fermentation stimulation protein homolog n=1 Tax=Sneathiella marina TaxID=2950108 RepID=A0ABY4VXF6_9PROT|nr:DNA/RNA nuclease SfsA [Sneathiella marina]